MIPSEQANRPRWTGRGFEIWFFVVLVPGEERALWVRLTRFADDEGSSARVWAVVSEHGAVTAEREVFPIDALTTEGSDGELQVRVGEAELGHGHSRGSCGAIRWDFQYDASDPLIVRMPQLPSFIPLGTHSTHPHAEAHVRGHIELDGRRIELDGGLFTQMHIWGTERVEWLRWAWVPRFVGAGEDTELELTAVAPKADGPNLVALWARMGEVVFDHTGLTRCARASVESPRPGVLHHVARGGGNRLVVRVWAAPETFAGWDYRKVGGGDLYIAQSNLANCEIELYRRVGLGWLPIQRLRSTCGALEFHGPDDYAEFHHVPWGATSTHDHPRPPVESRKPAIPPAPEGGEWIDTPAPARIVALGLTYAAHAKETASEPDSVVFEIDPSAWTTGDGELVRPSSAQVFAALAELDPGLPASMGEFGFLPAMLDYEVELGLVLLDGLGDPRRPGRVGLVVANDLSARTLQVLGEGLPDRLEYWRASKSFPGFMPTSARAWVPERFELDRWPALTLETRVNGERRQHASLEQLRETPGQMLARVREAMGVLAPGSLLLTGTPAGIAFTIPRWKRAMGERLLDRLGRLRAALGGFCGGTQFLRPADVVEVSAGYLGRFERVVVIE
jgi:2-keto-4-pentenoate hydratase/2-oxohepta-3-ene-1,7-dioic acid hydratase in catechol pathway